MQRLASLFGVSELASHVLSPVEEASCIEVQDAIERVLRDMHPRKAQIVARRLGLGSAAPATQRQLAREQGCSQQRISALEQDGLRELRRQLEVFDE